MIKKLNRKQLRNLIIEEYKTARALKEDCPTGMPCPIAAAAELADAGATSEEVLDWVAKLLQEFLSPVTRELNVPDADYNVDPLEAL